MTPQRQAGLFKSTDGGASCIRVGSGYPAGNIGNASQFFTQDDQRHHRRSRRLADRLPRVVDRRLPLHRRRAELDLGTGSGGDARSLVLDAILPRRRADPVRGHHGRGRLPVQRRRAELGAILDRGHAAVAAAVGGDAGRGFSKVVVALAPPTSPPNAAGVQVLYVSLSGTGGAPDPVGLFLSTDQGANWTQQAATGMPTPDTQGGYSFHMAVDPASPG